MTADHPVLRAVGRFFQLIAVFCVTVIVFVLLFATVLFRCLYPEGGRRLAATLLDYPVAGSVTRIFYSPSELESFRGSPMPETGAGENTDSENKEGPNGLLSVFLSSDAAEAKIPDESGLSLMNGITVIATPEPEPAPSSRPEEPAVVYEDETVMVRYGCVSGPSAVIFRYKPELEGLKGITVVPGEWCRVLGEESSFYHVRYQDAEYYVYTAKLDVYEVPDGQLPAMMQQEEADD